MKQVVCAGLSILAFSWTWAQTPAYICPTATGEAVYASEPSSVECQPAPILSDTSKAATQPSGAAVVLQGMDDVRVLPRQPAAPLEIHLRRPKAVKTTPVPVRVRPSPPVPKPLTAKQLIQRDIANEQRALNREKQRLQQAQQQGNVERIRAAQQMVADREANIRALQQELRRK